ncbi:MAG: cytochrome c biogenesis heme-transporting ATPase CcmA [Betaproteobacteria bacterium]|nr:cytochrome c biogenesis heme-transporting ATPase CcmA [Betaproteobacteria bacterium]MDE2310888.1 cytochrome c biogenesis heme-transporting ATPase CcmA [Betaproteobacteria bacterium]
MLEIINLACTRGDHQLFSGLSFSLSAGELLQVQGENGKGKTSLLRMLCGFLAPAAGEIRWRGQNIRELDEEYYAEMVYLGHLNAIKDELNALENLHISAGLAGCEVDDKEAIAALRHMGLRGRETLPVKVLSQGQRRRVALARLLVGDAPLWILDEPLTALDVGAVGLMQELIGTHLAKNGMVVFTTHQPLEVAGVETRRLTLA